MTIDVYFNLRKGGYSLRDGKTRLVTNRGKPLYAVALADVRFVVGQKSRQRVLESTQKNVHAFARGTPDPDGASPSRCTVPVRYDPYKDPQSPAAFYRLDTGEEIHACKRLLLITTDGPKRRPRMFAEL